MYWSQVRNLAGPPKINKLKKIKFKHFFNLIIVLTLFLLFEGFFWYYSSKLSYFCFEILSFSEWCGDELTNQKYQKLFLIEKFKFDTLKTGFNPLIWNENGIVETLQVFFLLISIIYFLQIVILKNKEHKDLFFFILIFYQICILYYFFEEISWGQHYFQWESPKFFIMNNNQEETNLHNITNLLDQFPRALLSIWCSLSFVIVVFFNKVSTNKDFLSFILPSKKLKNISVLLLIFILPDLFLDIFSSDPDYTKTTIEINFSDVYTFFSIN